MKKSQENIQDVENIIKEIERFLIKDPQDLIEYCKKHRDDMLYSLPHPNGSGELICGRKAFVHFSRIAERYLKSHKDKKPFVDLSEFTESIRKHFVWFFLKKRLGFTDSNINKMLSKSYQAVKKKFQALTHYIPCSIAFGTNPTKFEIGPVKFYHKSEFNRLYGEEINEQRNIITNAHIKRCEDAIKKGADTSSIATKDQSKQLGDKLVDGFIDFYEIYDWMAAVEIEKCSDTVSRQRAILAVKSAINILKLMLGGRYSSKMYTGYTTRLPSKSAKLIRSMTDNELHISLSSGYDGNILGDDWHKKLVRMYGDFLKTAEKTLYYITSPQSHKPLAQRFLDALYWYGDAVTEDSPASKIIKYVSSIECITVTGKEFDENNKEKIMGIVLHRSSMLASRAFEENKEFWEEELKQVYACRSDLLHGSVSPFDNSIFATVDQADYVAKHVLLAGLDYFSFLGFETKDFSAKCLKQAYSKLEEFICNEVGLTNRHS